MPSEVEKVARAIPDEAVEKALLVFYGGKLTVDEMWRINGEDLRPAMRAAVPGPVAAAVECWVRRFAETGDRPDAKRPDPA